MLVHALLYGLLSIYLTKGEFTLKDEGDSNVHHTGSTQNTCTGKWRQLPESTMCVHRRSPGASSCGVSEEDKRLILAVHNELRARVSPPHRNMMKMHWDDDLAAVAQKWASVCSMTHDSFNNREIPGWGRENLVGQSWAAGGLYAYWEKAIRMGWHSEVKNFVYGSSMHRGVVGHYTQLVRDQANVIGCGKCMCDNNQWPYYICNYYRGNSRDTGRPYMSGSPCQDCAPDRCTSDRLCDCGGRVCKHNGTMNLRTCTCDCPGRWYGDDCGYFNCPPTDGRNCGPGKFYDPTKCKQWSNVPNICPHMCGLCNGPRPTGGPSPTLPPIGGCSDNHARCREWAKKGECSVNSWMRKNCRLSCEICSTGTSPTTTTTPPSGCRDGHAKCIEWAAQGECSRNPWMLENCKLSCFTCDVSTAGTTTTQSVTSPSQGCEDKHERCAEWAEDGKCSNPWMPHNCRLSCKLCTAPSTTITHSPITSTTSKPTTPGCEDSHEKCPTWAARGECVTNKVVREICTRSCKMCGHSTTSLTTPATTTATVPVPTSATTPVTSTASTATSTPTKPTPDCRDTNRHCPVWAARGECNLNPDWMKENCRRSCNACQSGRCEDTDKEKCPQWAVTGHCVISAEWMLKNCRRSCLSCK